LQKAFQHIAKTLHHKKLLLTISGGIDSVVLAHLCLKNGLDIELAHCNFRLRGQESDDDEAFVTKFAEKWSLTLHNKVCDLSKVEEQNTQIAARNARYDWFLELKKKYHFDYILTAHHLDDAIETFFINLQRASGIKGLIGIPENEIYKRPLLNFTRNEIEKYAHKNNLTWREDSSNASDKYLRNKIRHQIIPKFEQLQPNFKTAIQKSMQYISQTKNVLDKWQEESKEIAVKEIDNEWHIDIDKLDKLVEKELFLHEYLTGFGFTDKLAVKNLLSAQSGKTIYAPKYRLTKHQNELIISQAKENHIQNYEISHFIENLSIPIKLNFNILEIANISMNSIRNAKKNEIYIDMETIDLPLVIRKWQAGDYFYPIGMKGKKKLSDYYKDQKISTFKKEKNWLLCSHKKIVWIIGQRADDRFKITPKTTKVLHIKNIK